MNQLYNRNRWRTIGSVIGLAGVITAVTLSLLWSNAHALRRVGGAFGCGSILTAIELAPEGKTVIPMVPARSSEGAVITKNIVIQGGWTVTDTSSPDCNGLGDNPAVTGTQGLRDAGFVFQAPVTRSALFYNDASVLAIDSAVQQLFIEHMELEHTGNAVQHGSGVYGVISATADVRIHNTLIRDSFATEEGGGLYMLLYDDAHLRLDELSLWRNSAGDYGGGLHAQLWDNARLTIHDSFFEDNVANRAGGFEIYLHDNSQLIIHGTVISDNRTALISQNGGGGRIVMDGGSVHINQSQFINNDAGHQGGGLYIEMNGGEVTIANSRFIDNESDNGGGGLFVNSTHTSSVVTLINTHFSGNTPDQVVFSGTVQANILTHSIYLPLSLNNSPSMVDTAKITGITIDEDWNYVVDFNTYNFVPVLPGQHVHFFFDTVAPEDAGMPGAGPWKIYGGSSPFTGYAETERPPFATHMCILAANPDHSVQPDSGNCYPLPVNQ